MEKRNWKRSVTLKQRMVLCLAAFFAAFALQLALNGYQARAVQQVQDDQMGNFNAISRFQGGVESSISILEAYRWENGETEEMLEKLRAACSTSNAWLWRIRSNMDGLQNVSDEQWVLYGAVETTYGSYSALLEELESCLSSGQDAKASQLYYNKVSVCGGYLSQYTMQLLKASILDAQTTYTEISELGERIALMQIVVVALCVALGCVSGLMVLPLLTPVTATCAIRCGVGIWNDYLVCRSLLNENKNPTLMVGINGFFGARAMEFGYAFAGIILVSLPMIILFLCLQKYFIKGIAAGAVKG